MSDIIISVIDPIEAQKVQIRASSGLIVADFVETLTDYLNMPWVGLGGAQLRYHLCVRKGKQLERLDATKTLLANGVKEGDTLNLSVETISPSVRKIEMDLTFHVSRLEHRLTSLISQLSNLQGTVARIDTLVSEQPKSLQPLLDQVDKIEASFASQIAQLEAKMVNINASVPDQPEILQPLIQQIANLEESFASKFTQLEARIVRIDELAVDQPKLFQPLMQQMTELQAKFTLQFTELETKVTAPNWYGGTTENPLVVETHQDKFINFDLSISGTSPEYRVMTRWFYGKDLYESSVLLDVPIKLPPFEHKLVFSQIDRDTDEEIGGKLFESIFVGSIRDSFRDFQEEARRQNLHMRLRFNLQQANDLAVYPWELLWNESANYPEKFLGQAEDLSIVRYFPLSSPSPADKIKPPLNMLVVTADVSDNAASHIAKEQEGIKNALKELTDDNTLNLCWLHHATRDTLLQTLEKKQDWHILHYIGHGGGTNKHGYITLENENGKTAALDAERLSKVLRGATQIQLVTLNTCHGSRESAGNPFASVAIQLAKSRIPAVVAMQHEIRHETAILFSRVFYKYLGLGYSVYTAMGKARRSMYFDCEADTEWAIPVLYSHSDGIIFKPNKLSE